MTPIRILLMAVAVMILCSSATAISLIKDEPPSSLPIGTNVTIGESIQERVDLPTHPTSIAVERIHPANVTPAMVITITLKVSNRGNERVRVRLTEDQRPGLQYTDSYELRYHNYEAMRIPYYSWDLTLEPRSTQMVTYHVKPEGVGMIAFTAALLTDEYGNQAESAMTSIKIACMPNGVCDAGENTIFCPQDCPSGSADGICDGFMDGKIDPDCRQNFDPDTGSIPVPSPTKKSPPGSYICIIAVTIALGVFLERSRSG